LTEMEGGLDGAEGLSLPRVVIEELRERARRAGSTVEEYVLDLLTRDEDPGRPGGGTLRARWSFWSGRRPNSRAAN
jgi:hypothetical protein